MKKFIARNRKTIAFRALYAASILSICLYTFVRVLFFEFPMTWPEEITFFLKLVITGSLFTGSVLIGLRWLYFYILKLRQRSKQLTVKLANTLFLKKNKEYVQYTAYSN